MKNEKETESSLTAAIAHKTDIFFLIYFSFFNIFLAQAITIQL